MSEPTNNKTPKPCPSCGGPEMGEFCPDDYIEHHNAPFGDLWQCACECGLSTAFCSTRSGAIAQWNMLYQGAPADVAREADADAHPWGEPGEPGVSGPALMSRRDSSGAWGEPMPVAVEDGRVYSAEHGSGVYLSRKRLQKYAQVLRFRKRWTPAAPEVK